MSETSTKIAAGLTLLALGGLAGAALSAESSPATGAAQTAAPVEVRTQVVRRTVHVIRREKPKRQKPTHATSCRGADPGRRRAPGDPARGLPARPEAVPPRPVRTRAQRRLGPLRQERVGRRPRPRRRGRGAR